MPVTTESERRGARRTALVLVTVIVVVAALAAVAIIVSARGDDRDGGAVATGVEQTRPVAVEGAALASLADGETDAAVGKPAPQVRGESFDGTPVAITADGRPKVIFFVAHWCPHCQAEVPVLLDWLAERGRPEGVDLYVVSTSVTDSRPNYPPSSWLEREGLDLPTLADDDESTAAAAFGLTAFPYFVALDEDNHVVTRTTGELPVAELDRLVDAARTGTGGA